MSLTPRMILKWTGMGDTDRVDVAGALELCIVINSDALSDFV